MLQHRTENDIEPMNRILFSIQKLKTIEKLLLVLNVSIVQKSITLLFKVILCMHLAVAVIESKASEARNTHRCLDQSQHVEKTKQTISPE